MSKQLKINNLVITFSDDITEDTVREAVSRGFAGINRDTSFVNLVKVSIGNIRADRLAKLMEYLRKDFARQGIENCIFVPLHDAGIQDITVDCVEVIHETT